jgi:hypothetical protein
VRAKIVTTITSYLDIDTMRPEHEVDVVAEDQLPRNVIEAVVLGGLKSAQAALEKKQD